MTLTLEWACGFEQFGAVSDINQVAQPWTAELSNGNFMSISTTTGVRSLQGSGVTPKALNLGNFVSSGVIWTVPNIGTRYLGMGWFLPALPAGEGNLFQFTETPPASPGGAGADGVRITLDNTGTVRIRQNSNNAVLVTSSAYAVSGNTQYWLSVSCNPNSGWVTLALNGTVIITATLGINFTLQYITFLSAGVSSVGQNIVVDDLVSYSTDGTDTASTLVPPRSVWTSLPNAVGDQTQWSRVGGASPIGTPSMDRRIKPPITTRPARPARSIITTSPIFPARPRPSTASSSRLAPAKRIPVRAISNCMPASMASMMFHRRLP